MPGNNHARTRIFIQLGGLIEKAGLLQDFGIELGSDLQKDLEVQKPVDALFYGLLELNLLNRAHFHLYPFNLKISIFRLVLINSLSFLCNHSINVFKLIAAPIF